MVSDRSQMVLGAIERADWKEVMAIAKAAMEEQARKVRAGAPRYSQPQDREQYFDLDRQDFIGAMHQAVTV